MIEIKNDNGNIDLSVMVGLRFEFEGKSMRVYEFNSYTGGLKVAIDIDGNGVDEVGEEINLNIGIERFINTLYTNYGLEIVIVEGVTLSTETVAKVNGLIQAGFSSLIINEEGADYLVDNLFTQTVLTTEELEHMLNKEIKEIELIEIL